MNTEALPISRGEMPRACRPVNVPGKMAPLKDTAQATAARLAQADQ